MSPTPQESDEDRQARALVQRYRQESAPQPSRALDRHVLRAARGEAHLHRWSRPKMATAAVLTLLLVAVLVLAPARHDGSDAKPRFMHAAARAEITPATRDARQPRLYSSDPPQRRDATSEHP